MDFGEQLVEVVARELPLERSCGGFVVCLEGREPLLQLSEGAQVVRSQHFTLHDREVDLDLVEPACMHGRVNRDDGRPAPLEAFDTRVSTMRRTVVHDPEYSSRGAIRFLAHDLMNETTERLDPCLAFTATEDLGPVDIPRGQVRPGSAADIFMLDSHAATVCGCQCRVSPAARLNAGLLVGRDHEIVVRQGFAFPAVLIQIEDSARLLFESGVAREDPTAVGPGADRILREPTPQGRLADRSHKLPFEDRTLDLGDAPARQRYALHVRELAGECLNGDHDAGGKTALGARLEVLPQGRRGVSRRSVCATC